MKGISAPSSSTFCILSFSLHRIFIFLLKHSWCTMSCQFLLLSRVTQSYIYTFLFLYYLPSWSIPKDYVWSLNSMWLLIPCAPVIFFQFINTKTQGVLLLYFPIWVILGYKRKSTTKLVAKILFSQNYYPSWFLFLNICIPVYFLYNFCFPF